MDRQYLCIDLKSFYASVECVERGLDPMTTNLVVADPERSDKTICLAVSPSMKALGVHNRCRVFEIPKNIGYIMAEPRMQKYIDYAAEIYGVYLKYIAPEDIHVYSIDEAFLDVTYYLSLYKMTAKELAVKIMDDIYTNYDLGFKNYDFHSLRHTHATMLLEKGANIKDVQHRLGHKNVQVTLQIYTHTTEKMQNQTIEILNQIPADGSCTPNFTRQPEEIPVFTQNSAKILPFNFSEKPRIFKGLEALYEELRVQNCTPKQELGYKWGTNDEKSSKNTIFDNKKEPPKKQPFSL